MHEISEARRRLEKEDVTFRRLSRKHREFESRLDELNSFRHLTLDEEYEVATLKKKKLALKDQMELLIRRSLGNTRAH